MYRIFVSAAGAAAVLFMSGCTAHRPAVTWTKRGGTSVQFAADRSICSRQAQVAAVAAADPSGGFAFAADPGRFKACMAAHGYTVTAGKPVRPFVQRPAE